MLLTTADEKFGLETWQKKDGKQNSEERKNNHEFVLYSQYTLASLLLLIGFLIFFVVVSLSLSTENETENIVDDDEATQAAES